MAAIAAYPLMSHELVPLARQFAVLAVLLLVAAVVLRVHAFIPAAVVAFAAEYALLLATRQEVDLAAPMLAVGLAGAAELSYLSLSVGRVSLERGVLARMLLTASVVTLTTVAVGSLLVVVSLATVGTDALLVVLGAAAAVLALVVTAFLARRS